MSQSEQRMWTSVITTCLRHLLMIVCPVKVQSNFIHKTDDCLYAADNEANELPRTGKIFLQTSRKGLVRMTMFSVLTCSIPSKEGVNTVCAIYEPERINKYINQSSQPGANLVKNMVYTCTPNNFCKKIVFIRQIHI